MRRHGASTVMFILGVVFVLSAAIPILLGVVGQWPGGENGYKGFFLAGGAFVIGNLLFVGGFDKLRHVNLIKNTPTSKVRSLAMGTVEVFGTVRPVQSDLLQSPFTGEDCVFYTYRVEEYRQQGDDSDWVTVDSGKEFTSFYIDDGTGQVLVDPRGADLKLEEDDTYHVDGGEEPPKHIQQFIERHKELDSENEELDLKLFQVSTGNDRRYHETFVTPGEDVYVFGEAMERPGKGSSQNEENIVINEKEQTPMFLVSDSSEKELAESMGHVAWFALIGGPILSLVGLAVLLVVLGLF